MGRFGGKIRCLVLIVLSLSCLLDITWRWEEGRCCRSLGLGETFELGIIMDFGFFFVEFVCKVTRSGEVSRSECK